jgi:hypothetical protein
MLAPRRLPLLGLVLTARRMPVLLCHLDDERQYSTIVSPGSAVPKKKKSRFSAIYTEHDLEPSPRNSASLSVEEDELLKPVPGVSPRREAGEVIYYSFPIETYVFLLTQCTGSTK